MRDLIRLIFLVTIAQLFVTGSAVAAIDPDQKQIDNGPCLADTIEECFHEGDWWWDFTVIKNGKPNRVFECGLTAGCQTCSVTSAGKPMCVPIHFDASCSCKTPQVPGAGPNIVECVEDGACTVRYN